MLLASAIGDFTSGLFALVIVLGLLAAFIASAVWFFRGPATAADRYVDALALQLQNPQDAALFRSVYKTKDPKSTTVAWFLTACLSPSIGYVYQGKWALAVISFVTLQGFFIWWLVAIFTTPLEVLSRNKRLADEAFNQVQIGRANPYPQGQVIHVNQYAYAPHPQHVDHATVAVAAEMPSTPPPGPGNQISESPPLSATPTYTVTPEIISPQQSLSQAKPPVRLD